MLATKGFCIVNIKGEMYFGEQCVAGDRESLQAEVDGLNDSAPDERWHIRPFFIGQPLVLDQPVSLDQHPLLMQAAELSRAVDGLPAHPEQTDLIGLFTDWRDNLFSHLKKHGLLLRS